MPFTACIAQDRKSNGLARCCGPMMNGTWDSFPWEVKTSYCLTCPFRFTLQASCSLDFLTISELDSFKEELSAVLSWLYKENPSWSHFNGSFYEVDHAYHLIGDRMPDPKVVIEDFIKCCLDLKMSEGFWKEWNYVMVEGWEGKPVLKKNVSGPLKTAVDKIVTNIVEPSVYSKKRLYYLYAASALLFDASFDHLFRHVHATFGNLTEACRKAVSALASLEIS